MMRKMALANLFRNPRRTLLTMGGIAVGVCCTYLFYGYVQHAYWGISEQFARSGNGHIQIAREEWFGASRPEKFRTDAADLERVAAQLRGDDGLRDQITAVSLKRALSGIVSTGEQSEVFVGQGIDPIANLKMSTWINLVDGKPLSPDEPNGVLLGKTLADRIGAKPGQNASLLLTTDGGRPNAIDVTVAGLIQMESKDLDAVAMLLPVKTALTLVDSTKADCLVIGLRDTEATGAALARVREILASEPGLHLGAKGWSEVAEYYQSVRNLYGRIFGFVQIMLFLVTLLAVINTIWMAVSERRGEIGMLRAIGLRRSDILRQFMYEGLLLGAFGGSAGLAVGWIVAFGVRVMGGIPMPPPPGSTQGYPLFFTLSLKGGLAILALALVSTAAASALPARRAAFRNIASQLALLLLFIALPARAATPGEVLRKVDELRRVPVDGFLLETGFKAPDSDTEVRCKVVGAGDRALAVMVSDPAPSRMSVLSSGTSMWMQKEGMRKPIRIAPGQRLVGQASNADVISVRFSSEYLPTELKKTAVGKYTLVLMPKKDVETAIYGKIELTLTDLSGKMESGMFYALSGKLLKRVDYEYETGAAGLRLAVSTISDAVRTELRTRVTHGVAKAYPVSGTFFNSENMLHSAKSLANAQ